MISQELKLQKANETIETLIKEITSLKEEKVLHISCAFIKGSDIQVVKYVLTLMWHANMHLCSQPTSKKLLSMLEITVGHWTCPDQN